ncbi:MAG: zf-HC2 domain-containing protein [Planctomycetaceae bacterium]
MTSPTLPNSDTGKWAPCHGGELQALVGQLQAHRRSRTRRRVASAVVFSSLLTLAGGVLAIRGGRDSAAVLADISCEECLEQAERYLAGALDRDLTTRIKQHLDRCAHCREQVEQLNGFQPVAVRQTDTPGPQMLLSRVR